MTVGWGMRQMAVSVSLVVWPQPTGKAETEVAICLYFYHKEVAPNAPTGWSGERPRSVYQSC